MIPLAVPNLNGNERKYLNDCIDTTFVSSVGEYVDRIESLSAELTGAKYGVATSAGTTALHTALIAVGVKRDDIVIIPSFTFIATANAVSHSGACTWLLDVDKDSWTLDINQLESELSLKTELKDTPEGQILIHRESGKRVAAIMPVYTLGNIPDMDRLRKIADKYKLPIVADAAAAIGSKYKSKKVAEMADLTVLSFNGNKTVTAGGGGMILGNDESLLKLCKHLTTTARVTKEYDFDMVGYNYRMTNLQAAVGVAQLERLEEFIDRKRYVREYYNRELSDIDGISFFYEPENVYSSCWFSGFVIENDFEISVFEICDKLNELGIGARSFWKPIHLQEPYRNALRAADLSVSESIWDRIVTLPCSTNISEEELKIVVDGVKKVISETH